MKDKRKIGIGEMKYIDDEGKEKEYIFTLPSLDKLPNDIYANQVVVHHTFSEFTLLFSRVQAPIKENQFPKDKYIEVPVVARIVLPPQVVESLVKALSGNYENYKKTYVNKKGK